MPIQLNTNSEDAATLASELRAAGVYPVKTLEDYAEPGGDRSTLPSFEARKLPTPLPVPPRAVHVYAWDDAARDVYPVNPKGPGLIGHGCGLPYGGDGGAAGIGVDQFGRFPETITEDE